MLNVTFHGVRAVPVTGGGRYGGHTSCVALEVAGRCAVLLDLGTGVERWVSRWRPGPVPTVHALLSRVDADRVAGLSSLPAGVAVEVYGPPPAGRRLGDAVAEAAGAVTPTLAPAPPGPAGPGSRPGAVRFVAVEDEELAVGDAKVMVRTPPDGGGANGYRVDWEGVSVAYVVDRQAGAGTGAVPQHVLELADGADLLIHAAGLRGPNAEAGAGAAVLAAREAGARCLALFHHHQAHDDGRLDRMLAVARRTAERLGVDEVIAAAEGTTVSFDR